LRVKDKKSGGGKIKKKLLLAFLIATTLSLLSIADINAEEVGNTQTQDQNIISPQETLKTQINEDVKSESAKIQNYADENREIRENNNVTLNKPQISVQKLEANTVKLKTSTSFTISEVKDAAARVKSYIETNHKLPNYVTIGKNQVKMPDFLKLLTAGLIQINSAKTSPLILKTVNAPSKPVESVKSGNIDKSGYLDLAKRVNAFIDTNGTLPNYANSNLGKLRYESLIYIFSRILNFQKVNNKLPNYVTVTPWSTAPAPSTTPTSLKQYLQATKNCQVTNAQIKALAASITKGTTSAYNKAVKIFNWVRDHISYENPMYYNTKYGAVGILKSRKGNCCDTSHLLVALERAMGIPARYVHGNCFFYRKGEYEGHVWAQVWINGKWYTADAISYRNTFGAIKNWNTKTARVSGGNYGTFQSLPF